jgi:glycosyltransferase involved in cell wall biosynthesis
MRLGIDGSNLANGGAITHLREVLEVADPPAVGFDEVVIWGPPAVLERLSSKAWLIKRTDPVLTRNYLRRAMWQRGALERLLLAEQCDLLFAPGGSFAVGFRPVVTMCRNMLPFDMREIRRFGVSKETLRLLLLRIVQGRSFRIASGTIFLTSYARESVVTRVGPLRGAEVIIPHGVGKNFFQAVKIQRRIDSYSWDNPMRLVYVSTINYYKHQQRVAEAVGRLRGRGYPLVLDLIGSTYPPALTSLQESLKTIDAAGSFVRLLGPLSPAELAVAYSSADVGIFASSCENMPNILLEMMASAMPIASAARGPMPEVLGDGGVYFDPVSSDSIQAAVTRLIEDPQLRADKAGIALVRAQQYSWSRCAAETFSFLARVARSH